MNGAPADNFDDFASDYRSLHNKNLQLMGGDSYYFASAKVQHVKDHEQNTNLNILDVGCGDGVTAVCMTALFPGCSITGIDVSAESIEIASRKKIPRTVFSVYNGVDFPFTDGCYDLVFIAGVLHHVDTPVQVRIVQEAYRVLKNAGRLYIFEHNPYNPATKYLVRTCVFDKHARLVTSFGVKAMLASGRFKKIRTRYITFFPRNRFSAVFHNMEKYMAWCPLGAQFYVAAVK